jgi:hypothetical protein
VRIKMLFTGPLLLAAFAFAPAASVAQTKIQVPTKSEFAARGIEPLKGDALRAFVVGNTLYHVVPANGFRVPLHYLADGTRYVKIRGEQIKSTWRIERDMVCEYSVVLKKEVCRSLIKADPVGGVCEEGTDLCEFGLQWAQGNPEGLGK